MRRIGLAVVLSVSFILAALAVEAQEQLTAATTMYRRWG
jgi:hypothetical protein